MTNYSLNNTNKAYKQSFTFASVLLTVVVSWFPISRFLLGFDYNGRTALFLALALLLFYFGQINKVAFKRPLIYFLLLNSFIILNSIFKGLEGFEPGPFIFITVMITPLVFMWMIVVMSQNDFDRTLKILLIIFYVYTLLTLLDGFSVRDTARFGNIINPNTLALNVLFTIVFASFLYVRKQFSLTFYIFVIFLPVIIEILTGSRMGVLSMALIIMSVYIIKTGVTSKNLFALIVIGALLYLGSKYVIDYTDVGGRLLSTQEESETFRDRYATGTILDYLGDRGAQYNLSWQTFLDNFWTGIGFGNWVIINPLNLVCHSQYMVLYLENGILAFFLYMAAVFWLLKRLFVMAFKRLKGEGRQTPLLMIAIIIVLLLMNLVLWTYDAYGYYAMFALAYVVVNNKKERIAI